MAFLVQINILEKSVKQRGRERSPVGARGVEVRYQQMGEHQGEALAHPQKPPDEVRAFFWLLFLKK